MPHTRIGSAVLLCLALSSFAIVVGFALLKSMGRQHIAGRSAMFTAQAENAALCGQAHAIESILSDFANITTRVNGKSVPAITYQDGAWRAQFRSHSYPDYVYQTQMGEPHEVDDVSEEHHLILPFVRRGHDLNFEEFQAQNSERRSGQDTEHVNWHYLEATTLYDGRGRYLEPSFQNAPAAIVTGDLAQPVTPVRFSDASPPLPARSDGLFLDGEGVSVPSSVGNATARRQAARYRMRYAVGIIDLQGQLLSNPKADMAIDWCAPNNDYRMPPDWWLNPAANSGGWLDRAANAWFNMANEWRPHYTDANFKSNTAGFCLGEFAEHVFRGRGNIGNVDRYHGGGIDRSKLAKSDSSVPDFAGFPATFPLMFRANNCDRTDAVTGVLPPFNDCGLYGLFYERGADNPNGSLFGYNANRSTEKDKFNFSDIIPNISGGALLTPMGQSRGQPYVHALVGPQLSWYNHLFCMRKFFLDGVAYNHASYGGDGSDPVTFDWDPSGTTDLPDYGVAFRSCLMTLITPFGRRLEKPTAAPVVPSWYHGQVDTPWHVNVLTAAPQAISQMLLAYIPRHARLVNGWIPRNRDLLVDGLLSEGLALPKPEFPPPGAKLDPRYAYHSPRIEDRDPGDRYPGQCETVTGDDLGKEIKTDRNPETPITKDPLAVEPGYLLFNMGGSFWPCPHTGVPLVTTKIPGTDDNNREPLQLVPSPAIVMDSFWRDILAAMCQAISFTKAVWVEYPNSVFDPSTGFQFADASEYDPAAHATLKDLDRLFLRQLGINIDQPGALPAESPQPITLIQQMAYDPWKPGNPAPPIKPPLDTVTQNSLFYYTLRADRLPENIYSLAKGTKLDGTRPDGSTDPSSERAKCMERVLNDFRVSFLGSSPRYTDFRPLDFDGDGKVMCSVYDQSPAASATENNNKTNRYASVVDATTGVGPAPARLFSASGNFFLGKSRFYRILTRGELYDNLLEKPVSQRLLETVVVVDPEGPLQTPFQASNVKLKGTRILYQSWIYDDSTSELPRQLR